MATKTECVGVAFAAVALVASLILESYRTLDFTVAPRHEKKDSF